MPIDLQIIRACEFVRVGAQGEFDFEGTRGVLQTLASACHKRGVERAMVDVRESTSNLTANDLAALVTAFAAVGFSRALRLAVLHGGNQEYRAKLFAFISAMRGWKVRAFESFEHALEWLSALDESDGGFVEGAVPIQINPPNSEPRNPRG